MESTDGSSGSNLVSWSEESESEWPVVEGMARGSTSFYEINASRGAVVIEALFPSNGESVVCFFFFFCV